MRGHNIDKISYCNDTQCDVKSMSISVHLLPLETRHQAIFNIDKRICKKRDNRRQMTCIFLVEHVTLCPP